MMSKIPERTRKELLIVIAFCLMFAGAGVAICIKAVGTVNDWDRMRFWQTVDATILTTELEVSRGGRDGGTTYEAIATYKYEFNSNEYEGNRVSIHTTGDNLGSFQERTYEELTELKQSGKPARCFVDPKDPTQSVLYRGMRSEIFGFELFFGLLFAGAGLGMLGLELYRSMKRFRQSRRRKKKAKR